MAFLLPILLLAAATSPYDIVIRSGRIVDGTGSPWYAGDIGIRGGRIAAIGRLGDAPARRTIDARGMVVAPGFIDMLGQSELTILVNPHLPSKIYQGITTEITGEGSSIAPLTEAVVQADRVTYEHYGVQPTWRTRREGFCWPRSFPAALQISASPENR
jgi:dihydroorotase/N-acyl-D-amino-acid deacylase